MSERQERAPAWVPSGHRADWRKLRWNFGIEYADNAIRARLDRLDRLANQSPNTGGE